MLGRKQSLSNDDWLNAMLNIKNIISKSDLLKLEKDTIAAIKAKTKNKKAAYAWSGGKDSLVLGAICEKAGIKECMMAVSNLEYPAFIEWVEAHKPEKLKIINTGQDINWLSMHPAMLFPEDSYTSGRWFSIVQHYAQDKYFTDNKLDMLLLGRRKADGNYVGKDNIYTNANGTTRYSPLADWGHEQILAYIAYNNIELPPIYTWHNGYKCGTHPWPARQYTCCIENGWNEVYQIDRNIVITASEKIESAKLFLERIKNENC